MLRQPLGKLHQPPNRGGHLFPKGFPQHGDKITVMVVSPLSASSPEELEPIFKQEIRCWKEQLFWDYTPAIDLIRKYMKTGNLPGFVERTCEGLAVGYAYYLIDPPVGYLGNIYVASEFAESDTYQILLNETVHTLRSSGKVERIECQVFGFNFDLSPLFLNLDFTPLVRHFLCLDLSRAALENSSYEIPDFQILNWERRFLVPAAEVVYDSYRGSPDYGLCRDYQSRDGCIRFLRNLVDNPGCGTFTPLSSYVAFDRKGTLCAVLVTSRIDSDTGMIPQISVRSDCQRNGLGTKLLRTYLKRARDEGLKRITLSVSGANEGAYQLYFRVGFQAVKDFCAFLWTSHPDKNLGCRKMEVECG